MTAVAGLGQSTPSISRYPVVLTAPLCGWTIACQVNRTSSQVTGCPSDHFRPGLRWQVIVLPSAETPLFCREGTSVARRGVYSPSGLLPKNPSTTNTSTSLDAVCEAP